MIALTGFRPDTSFLGELRVALDPSLEAVAGLAEQIDPNLHSCGTVRASGIVQLAQPEPDFYIVGAKSYGRAPTFLAMTGYEPDTSLLEFAGAKVDRANGKPCLSEHFETEVPGLYVAGTLCAGCESNTVFVENSRDHGPAIVRHILSKRR